MVLQWKLELHTISIYLYQSDLVVKQVKVNLGQRLIIFNLPPMTGSGVLVRTGDIGDIGSFAYAFPPKFMPFPLLLFPFSFFAMA